MSLTLRRLRRLIKANHGLRRWNLIKLDRLERELAKIAAQHRDLLAWLDSSSWLSTLSPHAIARRLATLQRTRQRIEALKLAALKKLAHVEKVQEHLDHRLAALVQKAEEDAQQEMIDATVEARFANVSLRQGHGVTIT